MKLEGLTDQLMATAAHRYCLGRASYIVGACLEWIPQIWSQLDQKTQHVMLRDTAEALIEGRAGHDIDVRGWTECAQWMWSQMDEPQRQGLLSALEHKASRKVICGWLDVQQGEQQ